MMEWMRMVSHKKWEDPSHNNSAGPTDPTDYNANRAAGKEIGLLYDWYTATDHENCSTSDQGQVGYLSDNFAISGANEVESKEEKGYIKGICPNGWHLPSEREWNKLEKHLTENATIYTQTPTTPNGTWTNSWETNNGRRGAHGTVMKSNKKVENSSSSLSNANSKTAQNGGFNGFIAGYALNGRVGNYGAIAYFWSASGSSTTHAYYRDLLNNEASVTRFAYPRNFLQSVRCKKD